jgi:pyrimidine operon attenuation protein/uracil phosphoribosyltransferase
MNRELTFPPDLRAMLDAVRRIGRPRLVALAAFATRD